MRIGPRKNRVAGFTIVELMVTITILAVLFGLLIMPLGTGMSLFQQTKARADVQADVRAALTQIARELEQAVVVYPNFGNSHFVDLSATDVYLQRIDFRLADRSPSGTLLTPIRPSGRVISYYVRHRDPTKAADDEMNPLLLFRAEFTPPSGSTAWQQTTVDLSDATTLGLTNLVHSAVISEEDVVVDRLTFQFSPTGSTTPDSITVNLTLKRFASTGSVNPQGAPQRVPQAQLKRVVPLRNLLR